MLNPPRFTDDEYPPSKIKTLLFNNPGEMYEKFGNVRGKDQKDNNAIVLDDLIAVFPKLELISFRNAGQINIKSFIDKHPNVICDFNVSGAQSAQKYDAETTLIWPIELTRSYQQYSDLRNPMPNIPPQDDSSPDASSNDEKSSVNDDHDSTPPSDAQEIFDANVSAAEDDLDSNGLDAYQRELIEDMDDSYSFVGGNMYSQDTTYSDASTRWSVVPSAQIDYPKPPHLPPVKKLRSESPPPSLHQETLYELLPHVHQDPFAHMERMREYARYWEIKEKADLLIQRADAVSPTEPIEYGALQSYDDVRWYAPALPRVSLTLRCSRPTLCIANAQDCHAQNRKTPILCDRAPMPSRRE
jgi:hypothetical protein